MNIGSYLMPQTSLNARWKVGQAAPKEFIKILSQIFALIAKWRFYVVLVLFVFFLVIIFSRSLRSVRVSEIVPLIYRSKHEEQRATKK